MKRLIGPAIALLSVLATALAGSAGFPWHLP